MHASPAGPPSPGHLQTTDVLIIGGGIQGLWLLEKLHENGYSALLVESAELGCEQTTHSQVYIHQGYAYSENDRPAFGDVFQDWEDYLSQRSPHYGCIPAYYGFLNQMAHQDQNALWTSWGLSSLPEVQLPPAFGGGVVACVAESPEVTVEARWLLNNLSNGRLGQIGAVRHIHAIRAKTSSSTASAEIELADGTTRLIEAQAIVLAAGQGNTGLLGQIDPPVALPGPIQKLKHGHVLVVKGPAHLLPALTCFVLDQDSLFVVGRTDGTQTAWLVSDVHSFRDSYDPEGWLPDLLRTLHAVFPQVMAGKAHLEWECYEGRKANMTSDELGARSVAPLADSVWAVCPWRLTLAPQVARQLLSLLVGSLAASATNTPQLGQPPAVASERWRTLTYISWRDFRLRYGL